MTDLSDEPQPAVPRHALPANLPDFLAGANVAVVDVRRGVQAGTRRLLLGGAGGGCPAYAVTVADTALAATAVQGEARVLRELCDRAGPALRATLPHVVGETLLSDRLALVLTAAPSSDERRRRPRGVHAARSTFHAVLGWLLLLWRETAGVPTAPDLGRDAADVLLARFAGSARLAATLGASHRARSRIGAVLSPRTASHGCLCPEHVVLCEGRVVQVVDWTGGTVSGEPLRDLATFAVRVAGGRLPEVAVGRSAYAHAVRDFVAGGLAAMALAPRYWRDVLVLAQLERAVAGLAQGDPKDLEILAATVRALPGQRPADESRKP